MSEELVSEVGLNNDHTSLYTNNNIKKTIKSDKTVPSKKQFDDDMLLVSDKPRRVRHNSAESAAEMSRKFPQCPEYTDFYTGQVILNLINKSATEIKVNAVCYEISVQT